MQEKDIQAKVATVELSDFSSSLMGSCSCEGLGSGQPQYRSGTIISGGTGWRM
jgi:hypothetical protein